MFGKSCWRARPCSPTTISRCTLNFRKVHTDVQTYSLMLGTSNFAGTQITHWDFKTKRKVGLSTWTGKSFFFLEVASQHNFIPYHVIASSKGPICAAVQINTRRFVVFSVIQVFVMVWIRVQLRICSSSNTWNVYQTRKTILRISESRFHRQTLTPLRPPLHEVFAFLSNIRPRLTCMRTSRKTDFRSSKNNFRGHDISQGLDRVFTCAESNTKFRPGLNVAFYMSRIKY